MVSFQDLLIDPAFRPYLPFIFVFVIVYGMLSSIKTLKWGNKVNIILSFVFAAFGAGYQPFLDMFYANFGSLLWFFVALFLVLFASDILGMRKGKYKGNEMLVMAVLGLVLLIALMFISLGYFSDIELFGLRDNELLIVIGIIFILIIFYYAYEHSHRDAVNILVEQELKRRGG